MSDKAEVNRHIENLDARAMARELKKLSDKVEALEIEMRAFLPDDTTSKPGSDGWIPWHGGECPLEAGKLVDVIYRDGKMNAQLKAGMPGTAKECAAVRRDDNTRDAHPTFWKHEFSASDIIAYRPAKQEAEPTVHIEETARQQGKSWAYNMYMQAQQEAEPEWPKVGDWYWYIHARGHVEKGHWNNNRECNDRLNSPIGIFRTKEAAEEAAGKIKRVMDHLRAGKSAVLLRSDAKDWVVSL